MKLKDLKYLSDTLNSLGDFVESNSGGDESGIADEMSEQYNSSIKIIENEKYRNYLRNEKVKLKRKTNFY